jgi:hypothetical protein
MADLDAQKAALARRREYLEMKGLNQPRNPEAEVDAIIAGGGSEYKGPTQMEDPYSKPFGPGEAIVEGLNSGLQEYVVDPLARRGYENVGAALATVPSVIGDALIPQTVGDVAMVYVKTPAKAGKEAYKALSKKASLAEKFPFQTQKMDEAGRPQWLFHEGAAPVKNIKEQGLYPRVGDISNYHADDELDDLHPLVFFRDETADQGGYAIMATAHKLGKDPADVTLADLKKHGSLSVATPDDVKYGDLFQRPIGDMDNNYRNVSEGFDVSDIDDASSHATRHVEPGDYVTPGTVSPSYIVTGDDLVEYLRMQKDQNHWVKDLFEKEGAAPKKEAMKRRMKKATGG